VKLKVALVQMGMGEEPGENLRRAVERCDRAADDGARLIVLPELFRSRYFCQVEEHRFFDLAEEIPGASTEALAEVARRRRTVIVASLFERRAPGVYHNTAAVLDADGSLAGIYRKMHIPDDPAFYEKFYFTPGDLGFRPIDTAIGKIGVLVCWDQWYPEAARMMTLAGADLLVYPTAIGWHPAEKDAYGAGQRDAWRTIQRSHAIANGLPVAAVNRTGFEPSPAGGAGIEFWGSSFLAGPFGEVVAEASTDREETLLAEIDTGTCEEVRRHWPFLRDRRIDAYGGLTCRWLDATGDTER
jgi:N-carbamoylputrescine amidase